MKAFAWAVKRREGWSRVDWSTNHSRPPTTPLEQKSPSDGHTRCFENTNRSKVLTMVPRADALATQASHARNNAGQALDPSPPVRRPPRPSGVVASRKNLVTGQVTEKLGVKGGQIRGSQRDDLALCSHRDLRLRGPRRCHGSTSALQQHHRQPKRGSGIPGHGSCWATSPPQAFVITRAWRE